MKKEKDVRTWDMQKELAMKQTRCSPIWNQTYRDHLDYAISNKKRDQERDKEQKHKQHNNEKQYNRRRTNWMKVWSNRKASYKTVQLYLTFFSFIWVDDAAFGLDFVNCEQLNDRNEKLRNFIIYETTLQHIETIVHHGKSTKEHMNISIST